MNLTRIVLSTGAIVLIACSIQGQVKRKPKSHPKEQPQTASQSTPAATKKMTNSDVIKMAKAHLSETVIINAINQADPAFDLSADGLVQLSNGGVSQHIIEYMQTGRPNSNTAVANTASGPEKTIVQSPAPVQFKPDDTAAAAQKRALEDFYKEHGFAWYSLDAEKRSLAPISGFAAVQTKAKGATLSQIASDPVTQGVVLSTVPGAATAAGTALAKIPLPIFGAAIAIPYFNKHTYTTIFALDGPRSQNIYHGSKPVFEFVFSDLPGANPDEFTVRLIKLTTTPNNFRIAWAMKTSGRAVTLEKSSTSFIEDVVPSTVVRKERGVLRIEPKDSLSEGEYAVVVRPITKTFKFDLRDIDSRKGELSLLDYALDFRISTGAAPEPKTGDPKLLEGANVITPKPASSESKMDEPKAAKSENITNAKTANPPSGNSSTGTQERIYGSVVDAIGLRKVYVDAEDSESRERIVKTLYKAGGYTIVGDPRQAEFELVYTVLTRDHTVDKGDKETKVRGQLSAIVFKNGAKVTAWSDTAEFSRTTSSDLMGLGFRNQYNETKLTEKFLKAMKQ